TSSTQMYNVGLSADSYYCGKGTYYGITSIPTCSGASAASATDGVTLLGTFPAAATAGARVRVLTTNSTPTINGIHYVVAG
ncbi:hypothetical protein ACI3PL_29755, partial [Lacticaseibacillus paracasei]